MKIRSRFSFVLALLLLLAPASAFATGSLFDKGTAPPGPADDVAPSMGVFRIAVEPAYQAWCTAIIGAGPFWDASTGRLTSPVLYDNNTTIGRSAAHTQGSTADLSGTPVGTAGTIVKDANITFPVVFNTTNPARYEVHTEVRSFNLVPHQGCGLTVECTGTGLPVSVKAGTGNGLPLCPGEVESNSNDGFPAKSLFNMFVEVDLGSGVGGLGPMRNLPTNPLIVVHDPIGEFPPKVVYIHENPVAVPIYFTANGSSGIGPSVTWNAGDRFGYLVLAGHGEDLSCADSTLNCAQFWSYVTSQREMPLPGPAPSIGEWGLMALAMLLVLAGLWSVAWRRRSAMA